MDYYFTYMNLLGIRDSNLPPFRDARLRRYKSVKKMVDLISIAGRLSPRIPTRAFMLDPTDPEWDDIMPFPAIDHSSYAIFGLLMAAQLWFYSYNYNIFTGNFRFRTLRNLFPFVTGALVYMGYGNYKQQITKINLFDEYCWLRAQELAKQNEYLFKHPDFKRFIWWHEDFKDTLQFVHRQANDHEPSDFRDSEILLQDFISRYSDPKSSSPMKDAIRI